MEEENKKIKYLKMGYWKDHMIYPFYLIMPEKIKGYGTIKCENEINVMERLLAFVKLPN